MDTWAKLEAFERTIGRQLPEEHRTLLISAGGLDSVLNEEETGEVTLFGLRRLSLDWETFGPQYGVLPFCSYLMGAYRLGLDRQGHVVDLHGFPDREPRWKVIAQDVRTWLERVELEGHYWLIGG